MSTVSANRNYTTPMTKPNGHAAVYEDEDTGFGWLFFAATMLGLAGVMRVIDSIWAFNYGGALPENLKDGVLGSNLHTYAWVWLGVGAVLLLSSFLVMVRSQFGRWIGYFAAVIGGVAAITWMPYYPIWSLVYVVLAVLVLYALVVHGGRAET